MESKRYVPKMRTGGKISGQLLINIEAHKKMKEWIKKEEAINREREELIKQERLEWKKKLRSLPYKSMKEESETESDTQTDEEKDELFKPSQSQKTPQCHKKKRKGKTTSEESE